MSMLVPTSMAGEIIQGNDYDIVITPKYAPLKDIPEFIVLSARAPET